MGSHRVGHDGSDLAAAAAATFFSVPYTISKDVLLKEIILKLESACT